MMNSVMSSSFEMKLGICGLKDALVYAWRPTVFAWGEQTIRTARRRKGLMTLPIVGGSKTYHPEMFEAFLLNQPRSRPSSFLSLLPFN